MNTYDRSAADLSAAIRQHFRSHSERVELAVLDVLRADPILGAFFVDRMGSSCILRVTGARDYPERPWPLLLVYPISLSRKLEIGPTFEMGCAVGVTLLYDELRSELTDDEVGVQTFGDYIVKVLAGRSEITLLVSRWGLTRATVEKLERVAVLSFGPAIRSEDVRMMEEAEETGRPLPADFNPSGLALELQFDYSYTVDRDTMTPAAFDPEE